MLNSRDALLDFQRIVGADPNLEDFCANEQSWIEDRRQRWEQNRIQVGVIGVTSSGKSTLINAILGRQLLTSAVCPSSAQLVYCSCGEEAAASVRFLDGTHRELSGQELTAEALCQYSDERSNPGNKKRVSHIALSTPTFDLGEDVLLIDSPGLDAYGFEGHEKLTLESLVPTVDACIYVTTTKQNSDRKAKNVLDIVAKYHCPIIIVQNMLDAVTPSPGGDKTWDEVVLEHKMRVQRIVAQSDIEDKSSVRIIQMSAKSALPWRCGPLACGTEEKKRYLDSRYPQFRDSVRSILAHQRPRIERQRLKTIYERAAVLQRAAQEKVNVPVQKLESVFPLADFRVRFSDAVQDITERGGQAFARYADAGRQIRAALSEEEAPPGAPKPGTDTLLRSLVSAVYASSAAPGAKLPRGDLNACVEATNKAVAALGNELVQLISDGNALITQAAGTVNIPDRDLRRSLLFAAPQDIHVQKKAVTTPKLVPKKGFFNRVARFFGDIFTTEWGYDRLEVKAFVPDEEATRDSILRQLALVGTLYEKEMEDWFSKSLDPAVQTVLQSIDEQEDTYDRQKRAVVEIDSLRRMCGALARFLERLEQEQPKDADAGQTDDVPPDDAPAYGKRQQIEAADYIKPLVELSRLAVRAQHRQFFRCFMEKIGCLAHTPVIVGWDDISRDRLLWQSGITDALYLSPAGALDALPRPAPLCLFVLVNTTQIGQARKQIDALCLKTRLTAADRVIWVVQDLQELLNGGNANDGLSEMQRLGAYMQIPCESFFYVCHENPIYAWALLEVQMEPELTKTPHLLINTIQNKYGAFTSPALEKTLGHLLRELCTVEKEETVS